MLRFRIFILPAACLFSTQALAGSEDADALFREGRALMNQGELAAACPKLAKSYEIDPATGALLALAVCYERSGKYASAWSAYKEAAVRSKRENRPDRESAARERASVLETKLSKLTIEIAPKARAIAGLVVKRDGAIVPEATWGKAVPIDGGEHEITASAPGYRSSSQSVEVGLKADRENARIEELQPLESGAPAPHASPSSPAQGNRSTRRTLGIVTGAVGVVALGVGSYFGVRAKQKNDDSNADCDGNVCGPIGKADRLSARRDGNIATVAFIAGGVLVATGVTLYVTGSPTHPTSGFTAAVGGRF